MKSIWRSKTLWFNAIVAALGALQASANLIQPLVPGNAYGWGLLILTVGNTILRTVTTQAVSLAGKGPSQ